MQTKVSFEDFKKNIGATFETDCCCGNCDSNRLADIPEYGTEKITDDNGNLIVELRTYICYDCGVTEWFPFFRQKLSFADRTDNTAMIVHHV